MCSPVLAGTHSKFFGSIELSQAGISKGQGLSSWGHSLGLILKFNQVSLSEGAGWTESLVPRVLGFDPF